MNKYSIFTIPILIAIIFSCITITYAQDSVKRKSLIVKGNIAKPIFAKYNGAAIAKPTGAKPASANPVRYQYALPKPTAADSALMKDKSLNGQYQYLLTKLYHYQQPLVAALWKNMKDTLTTERRQLKEANTKLADQDKTITGLQTDVTTKDQTLSVSNARRDEINLIGIPFTKATYNLIMWGLVIVFGVAAVVVIARSGSHSREAKYRTKLHEELDEEYKAYKSKANEKEKKLARELQTERNKLDELLGRG